jgi:hypothetical protein
LKGEKGNLLVNKDVHYQKGEEGDELRITNNNESNEEMFLKRTEFFGARLERRVD